MANVLARLPCKPRYILLALAVHGLLIWTVAAQWSPRPLLLPAAAPVMEISLAPVPAEPAPPQVTPPPAPPPPEPAPPPPEPTPPPVTEPEPPAPVQRVVPPKPAEPPKPLKKPHRPVPPKPVARPLSPPRETERDNPPVKADDKPVMKAPSPPAVTEPVFDAAYLNNPLPDYPRLARRAHQQGTVMLSVLVSAAGTASQVTVAQSSGSDELDDAALRAVKRWRFVPAKRGNEPIDGWVRVPVVFRLGG